MSHMLANRYFLAGRFVEAADEYERVLLRHPRERAARRKLIVCYALTGRVAEALELAIGLYREDPGGFPVDDPHAAGFPCGRIDQALEQQRGAMGAGAYHASRGVLELFCDEVRALGELTEASRLPDVPSAASRLRRLVARDLEERHVQP